MEWVLNSNTHNTNLISKKSTSGSPVFEKKILKKDGETRELQWTLHFTWALWRATFTSVS